MLGLLWHAHVGVFMEALLDEVALGRIALSCHIALDVLCDKRRFINLKEISLGTITFRRLSPGALGT